MVELKGEIGQRALEGYGSAAFLVNWNSTNFAQKAHEMWLKLMNDTVRRLCIGSMYTGSEPLSSFCYFY